MPEAQTALRSIAFDLVRLEERRQEVLDSLPRSENEAAMFEGASGGTAAMYLTIVRVGRLGPPLW